MPEMQLQTKRTMLSVIAQSVGAQMFRNNFAVVDGKEVDLCRDGKLSCAFFVSSVLAMFRRIGAVHTTVSGTVKDLEGSGWVRISEPEVGCVVVWEAIQEPGIPESHRHIGFYVGDEKAISNSSSLGYPVKHDWQFRSEDGTSSRRVELMLATQG